MFVPTHLSMIVDGFQTTMIKCISIKHATNHHEHTHEA